MKDIILKYLLLFLCVESSLLSAQCPGADDCGDAYTFCSLEEMNGFTCSSKADIRGCRPLCTNSPGPVAGGRHWWSFISDGGNVSITLTAGTCDCIGPCNLPAVGFVFGIMGDCECKEVVTCIGVIIGTGKSFTQTATLKPCKRYYLIVDNSGWGGWCDFTITTSRGGPPTISPLGDINNIAGGIIQPVCEGQCDYKFFVDPAQSSCPLIYVNYIWTLDGVDLGKNSTAITLDFPDKGDFELCVTALIGDPKNAMFCNLERTKCAKIKVTPLPDRIGKQRTLCFNEVSPNSYKWHNQFIDATGTYREKFTLANCCPYDSIVDFIVLPPPKVSDVLYISCDNKPYVDILGRSHNQCIDSFSLPNITTPYRCDSSIRLTSVGIYDSLHWQALCAGTKVELNSNFSLHKKCNIGETYSYDFKWYKKSDTTKAIISNSDRIIVDPFNEDYCLDVDIKVRLGKDSAFCIKTYCETINESSSGNTIENISLNVCDSAIINNQKYVQSTQFTQQLKNTSGCDSTVITDLTISKSSVTDLKQSGCDSLIINNQAFTQSGIYTQSLMNVNNCDSVIKLDLDIGKSSSTNLILSSCDSINVNNQVYKLTNIYTQLLMNTSGCDSTINLDLTIHSSSQTEINKTDCDSVVFNGKTYKQTGDYTERYASANGCDSMVVLHVNIPNSNTSPLVLSRCDSITINGQHYTQSGSYTQKLISANGCDSILNIDLTIVTASQANIVRTGCDTVVINNMTYTQSGIYQQKLQTAAGCDSALNIDLNIVKSSIGDTLFYSCDSIKVNGITYHQSGIYKQTLTNSNQCDSTLIIDFTRLSKSSTARSYKSCDSIVVNQQVYKQSGNYTQIFVNTNQCDSILNLNIEISKSNTANINLSSCDSTRVNGQLYIQSGNYTQTLTNSAQCDSLLNINLTINKGSSIAYPFSTCDSANINGQIYKQSGHYTQYLKSVNQCDSIINIQLAISKSNASTLAQEGCDSIHINGTSYYSTGNYQQKLTTNNGCDSTLTLSLIIKPGNPSTLEAGKDTSICEGAIIKLNGIFSGPANFNWQSTSGSFDHPNNLSTNYYPSITGKERIYLQASDDCKEWLDSFAIQILPNQFVQVTGDTIIDPCKEKEISFIASGGTNYSWTPSSNIVCLDPPCSQVKLRSNVAARFTITTDGSCAFPANLNLSESQIQSDVYFPTIFSPNGDNINDVFIPMFNCEQITYYNLQIYDRWGNLMFESRNNDLGWNGKQNGVILNPGVYIYVMEYELHNTDRKVKGGDVTLIR